MALRQTPRPPLVVMVWVRDGDKAAGVGFAIGPRHVVTCAHVVYDCGWVEKGHDAAGNDVLLKLAGVQPNRPLNAKVLWSSVYPATGDIPESDDICVLELIEELPEYATARTSLLDDPDALRTQVTILGFPAGGGMAGNRVAARTFGTDGRGLVVLERADTEDFVVGGFSGAPGVTDTAGDVLGMVVTSRTNAKRAFMIPTGILADRLTQVVPALGLRLITKMEREFPHVARLRELASKGPSGIQQNGAFAIDAALCDRYEDIVEIHRGTNVAAKRISAEALVGLDVRAIYLQAPGGFGKTSFLMRLLLAAIRAGKVPFWLDAGQARPAQGEPNDKALNRLFDDCTKEGGRFQEFLRAANDETVQAVVIVDGLNENLAATDNVISVVDYLARNYGNTAVYVADRMSRRQLSQTDFKLATVLPIDLDAFRDGPIADALKGTPLPFKKLLSTPFFLDLYLDLRSKPSGIGEASRAGMLRAYFSQYAGANTNGKTDPGIIRRLSELAIEVYRTTGLQFSRETFAARLDASYLDHLLGVGVLVERGTDLAFRHQLFHDFLVGLWLSESGNQAWRQENFDTATLRAKSFEALELASELLKRRADEFIIEVYDWSYIAALTCVLNLDAGMSGQQSPLPDALKDAIFAMNAEKRYDPFSRTRQRAIARLQGFRSGFAINYAVDGPLTALIGEVAAKYRPGAAGAMSDLYANWIRLFSLPNDPAPRDWALLQDSPLLAWTAANVFRRSPVVSPLADYLDGLYTALRHTQAEAERALATRWRIAHILGASDEPFVPNRLASIMEDAGEGRWVRLGAARGLIEVASRAKSRAEASQMLRRVIAAMPTLPPEVLTEICEDSDLAGDVAAWWDEEYERVLETGAGLSKDDPRLIEMWRARKHDTNAQAAVPEHPT